MSGDPRQQTNAATSQLLPLNPELLVPRGRPHIHPEPGRGDSRQQEEKWGLISDSRELLRALSQLQNLKGLQMEGGFCDWLPSPMIHQPPRND